MGWIGDIVREKGEGGWGEGVKTSQEGWAGIAHRDLLILLDIGGVLRVQWVYYGLTAFKYL